MLALAGCGAPISNQVFLDEAAFVEALPSDARLHAPSSVLLAPNGDAAVLDGGKAAAAQWDAWWAIAAAAGEELRAADADERTEVARRWDAVNVAARITGDALGEPGVVDVWVQAEVIRPADQAAAWSMSLANSADGPWVAVGAGETEDGAGTLTWDLAAMVEVLGASPPAPLGTLSASFADVDDTYGVRSAAASYDVDGFVVPFGLVGEEVMSFSGPLAITADGASWAAFATVVHLEGGGRAQGAVYEAGTERTFTSCWDASGLLVWQQGEGSVLPAGTSEVACAIGPF